MSQAVIQAQFVIGGEAAPSVTGEETKVKNPSTGEIAGTVSKGNREDVKRAIDAAEQGFKVWSRTAPAERGAILWKGAKAIEQNLEELASSLTREQGKPIKESRMEIRRFQHTLEYYAGLGKNLRSVQIPMGENRFP
jgi:acyl-CoA reductase-like NAD-dependent aldehyde dehydrogenase